MSARTERLPVAAACLVAAVVASVTAQSPAVPDMTGPNEGTNPVQDDGSKRMGDEGKLPATGAGSNAVPDMTAPSK